MSPQAVLYIIIGIFVIEYVFGRILTYLNSKSNRGPLPEELKDTFDEEKYLKTQEYEKVNTRFGVITGTFSFLLILLMLIFGGFGMLDQWVRTITGGEAITTTLLFFGVLAVASDVLGIPLELYHTFVIEEKFGFNKMTIGTYVADKVKGYLVGGIIGVFIISFIVWFYETTGEVFWLYAWGLVTFFMIIMTALYGSIIVPMFNKLTPLEEGELRTAIEEYASKVNFKLQNVFVIDGSKRSGKSNAYFTGLGPKKKIVLYDTLIEQHTTEELVAVLAHEIGHYKKKHIPVSMVVSILQTGLVLYILSLFVGNPVLSQALGGTEPSFHLGLVAFGMLYSPISTVTGILMNMLSRKNEYEADNYAATTYKGKALKNALKKLSANNLSNLRPHPLYVFINYSHPPLLSRLKAIG